MESMLSGDRPTKKTKISDELLGTIQTCTKRINGLNSYLNDDTLKLKSKTNDLFGLRPECEEMPVSNNELRPGDKRSFLEELFVQLSSLQYEIDKSYTFRNKLQDEIQRLDELI